MDVDAYVDKVIAKIDAMSCEDLSKIFSDVLDEYEKSIPLMAIPVVVPNLSTKRTFILISRKCNMCRKCGDSIAIRRNQRK